jgi:hypothetical protein
MGNCQESCVFLAFILLKSSPGEIKRRRSCSHSTKSLALYRMPKKDTILFLRLFFQYICTEVVFMGLTAAHIPLEEKKFWEELIAYFP